MTIDILDKSLNPQNCADCYNECLVVPCQRLVAIGPCSTIISDDGTIVKPQDLIFDVNTWCRVLKLQSATYNPNSTIVKDGYVGECYEETKAGRDRPTIEISYRYCKQERSHCFLNQNKCLVGFMMMEDRADFIPNVSPTILPNIRYGIARVQSGSSTWRFDEDDIRTATLHVHSYMWEFNFCSTLAALGQARKTGDRKAA